MKISRKDVLAQVKGNIVDEEAEKVLMFARLGFDADYSHSKGRYFCGFGVVKSFCKLKLTE